MIEAVVIGGGIAGVAAGYYLAEAGCHVALVEQESTLAYHSTGRSAALYFENYGEPAVRALTKASRPFFEHPPGGLAEVRFLRRRGALWVGRPEQRASLERELESGSGTTKWLEAKDAQALVPALRTEYLGGAVWEPDALDLDVAAIHQAFVRGMRMAGATIRTSSEVTRLAAGRGKWEVMAGTDVLVADVVINAAGAWGDVVAGLAGVAQVGLEPRRRTAFMVPGDLSYAGWPLVADADNEFYFRPDGTQILCSLADETPAPPGDARPDELDIALAIDRINTATTLGIRSVRSAWAGLRSFVVDRAMVVGFDPDAPGFFWLVGQGGTG
ncbi:MAG: FAD-binding oxidoreductase, partial [Acidimicrobiia bacterium]|nr:FAD-binding oxidoreductase [Acidimicrobiia bacterium]